MLTEEGVCLTEMMLSLTTGAIVLAAAMDTFNMLHRQTVRQHRNLASQQELRVGLEVFEQEVRLATADSIVAASAEQLSFSANINAQSTKTTVAVTPGQSVVPVDDGSGWGAGKNVMLCGRSGCEMHQLSRVGQRHQLTLAEPIGQLFPVGATIEVMNRVVYYCKREDGGRAMLMRMVDGGASALIKGADQIRLSYWDDRGHAMRMLGQTKRVVIDIKLSESSLNIMKEVSLRS